MARLANSRMQEGSDPDIFFRNIDQLAEDLEGVGEQVSTARKKDIILTVMPSEYDLVRLKAMKDPDFTLENMQLTMRNLYVNGFTNSKRRGRGTAMSAGSIKHDKSKVKCHSCGKLGHHKNECTSTGADRKSSSNPRRFKPRKNDSNGGKKKLCSLHKTRYHDNSECHAQKDGRSAPKSSNGKQQGGKSSASTAAEEQHRETDTVSKGEIAKVFKHISMSLMAEEKDSNTSDQNEDNTKPGFCVSSNEQRGASTHGC